MTKPKYYHVIRSWMDLSQVYFPIQVDSRIRLGDYEVCKALHPTVSKVVDYIHFTGERVQSFEITSEHVRAYLVRPKMKPYQEPMPKGLMGHLLDISAGPNHDFPIAIPELPRLIEYLDEMHGHAFPMDPTVGNTLSIGLTYADFALIGWWCRSRFKPNCSKVSSQKGFMGTLWEHDGFTGRSVSVYCYNQ